MSSVKHDVFFRNHPVFTGEELAAHLLAAGQVGSRTQESLLAYHTKASRLVRVRRGLYAVIPPESDRDTYPIDPYLVASRLTPDAVLSHHTALEFHGRTYSVWRHLFYLAERPPGTVTFRSHVFRGTRFPEALVRSGNQHFGVLKAERAGMSLRVASLERTLVDVLDRPDLAGGWEEVWRSRRSSWRSGNCTRSRWRRTGPSGSTCRGRSNTGHYRARVQAIRLYVSGKITEKQLDRQRKFTTERLETLRLKLDDYRAREMAEAEKRALGEHIVEWAHRVGGRLDDLGDEERREVLRLLLDGATIDRSNNVDLTLAIPTQDVMSIAGQSSRCYRTRRLGLTQASPRSRTPHSDRRV